MRIAMTCKQCKRRFTRSTRVGKTTTCPHCKTPQLGPQGLRERDEQLAQQQQQQQQKQRTRHRQRPSTPAPTPEQDANVPVAPGKDTRMPRHPDARPPEPAERHPTLFW